jgi:hypothetical protein
MFRSQNARTHLFQIVFSKGNISKDNYPMSRAFLYGDHLPDQSEGVAAATSKTRETSHV